MKAAKTIFVVLLGGLLEHCTHAARPTASESFANIKRLVAEREKSGTRGLKKKEETFSFSKWKVPGEAKKTCELYKFYLEADMKKNEIVFSDFDTGEQLGYAVISDHELGLECSGFWIFKFGMKKNECETELYMAFTCYGLINSILGGSGEFGCGVYGQSDINNYKRGLKAVMYVCGPRCIKSKN